MKKTLLSFMYVVVLLTTSLNVFAANQLPNVVLNSNVSSGEGPLTVSFSSAGTSDPDGFIIRTIWRFGDGSSSLQRNPSHIYTTEGVYTATLTVIDNRNGRGSATKTITVTSTPPPPPPPGGTDADLQPNLFTIDNTTNWSESLSLSYVDGSVIRHPWETAEATSGVYNFSTLCSKITSVMNVGKKMSLVNFTYAPRWLADSLPGTEVWFSSRTGNNQPHPWNQTALTAMANYATAEANFVCNGVKIKDNPSIINIDTPIVGMQSIRNGPTYTLSTMKQAIVDNVAIWHTAFESEVVDHAFYVGWFPLNSNYSDTIEIRNAVQDAFPNDNLFQETWTGGGPSGDLMNVLVGGTAGIMLQACGGWSDHNYIAGCYWRQNGTDSPQYAYDTIAAPQGVKYFEFYPIDLRYASYTAQFQYIHDAIHAP
ncbi:MAG: PKD domain-containing protein [Nitrososphaeraceae archaeon]